MFHNAPPPTSRSPIYSSSYLPNLEAGFCKDYSCCGLVLPNLHDLLRHYEEAHISQQDPDEQPQQLQQQHMHFNNNINSRRMDQNNIGVSTDDVFISNNRLLNNRLLNTNTAANQNQNLHQSNHNNNNMIMNNAINPHNPGNIANTNINLNSSNLHHQHHHHANHHHQSNNHIPTTTSNNNMDDIQMDELEDIDEMEEEEENEMCIDDPARHLYVADQDEYKPFKCPVIGCDKTYKNQNGLKYHRLHGHQNQTLHLNDDGTYSVIDPLSNEPYPEGVELEKDKPYRCEVCGKRYKNLNGLKYHRGHSTH